MLMQSYLKIMVVALLSVNFVFASSVNLVVFSCDRPLQLQSFLHSFYRNVQGCKRVSVIYRCTALPFVKGYNKVQSQFPQVHYLQQNSPEEFKKLTETAIDFDQEKYVVFAVDDMVVTRPVNFDEITVLLPANDVQGFYLRLGKNITACYMELRRTGRPQLTKVADGVYRWILKAGEGDWNYPYTLDMAVYPKSLIKSLFRMDFNSPNTMEMAWSEMDSSKPAGLCYKYSCVVNCPLNRVQTDSPGNRNSNSHTTEHLLKLFLDGSELDINPLQFIKNKAPHIDYQPKFKKRSSQ